MNPLSPDPDTRPYAADRSVAPVRDDGPEAPRRESWRPDPDWPGDARDWPSAQGRAPRAPDRDRGTLGGWIWALRRHIAAILVGILLGAVAAVLYSVTQETLYSSRSDIVVTPSTKFLDPTDSDAFPALTTTVQALATTRSVLADASGRLALVGQPGITPAQLDRRIDISVLGDTPVLVLQARAATQERANATAAAVTGAVETAINRPPPGSQSVPPGVLVRVFSRAVAQGKVQPRMGRNVLLGANIGLLLGLLLAIALFPLNRPQPAGAEDPFAEDRAGGPEPAAGPGERGTASGPARGPVPRRRAP